MRSMAPRAFNRTIAVGPPMNHLRFGPDEITALLLTLLCSAIARKGPNTDHQTQQSKSDNASHTYNTIRYSLVTIKVSAISFLVHIACSARGASFNPRLLSPSGRLATQSRYITPSSSADELHRSGSSIESREAAKRFRSRTQEISERNSASNASDLGTASR